MGRYFSVEKKWKGFLGLEIGIYVVEVGRGIVLEGFMYRMVILGLGFLGLRVRLFIFGSLCKEVVIGFMFWELRIYFIFF